MPSAIGQCLRSLSSQCRVSGCTGLAGTAANGRVVKANVAAATRIAAASQAIAARLNHFAASLIARQAGDAAAVLGVFAFANPHGEVALANGLTVAGTAAATQSIGQHAAQVLQRGTGHVVVANAVDLNAASALFELHGATWHHAPVGRRWRTSS